MMVPEYGQLALIIALVIAVAQFIVPAIGLRLNKEWIMAYARPLAIAQATFLLISLYILGYGFVHDDFSISYIANNSNTALPYFFKISAIWGAHEGSLLLWIAMLGSWGMAVAIFSRSLPLDMIARVLSILGLVSVGFILFIVETSNPFARSLPGIPTEGADLNPLLQDFGLIVHPPMLYMGYVGLSVAFAFAMAALMEGRLDAAWARWTRPWTTAAWVFLTLGIALGSWWAYYELGWGGWWFWDPVENASFLPWLVGTALIHSLAVTEKRGMFKSWTILLAIFTFSLSLLGTFLVRSGVLTSVHAFANDPERGVFILGFLLLVVGGSLTLYALRAPVVKSMPSFNWLSRETLLLSNNILLVVVMITVLLGTLYPLLADALGWGTISVGPPYFNFFFLPLMGVICLIMAIGPLSNWKRTSARQLANVLWRPWVLSLLIGLVVPYFYSEEYSKLAALSIFIGSRIFTALIADIWHKLRNSQSVIGGLSKLSLSYYGMVFAHAGIAVTMLGVCLTSIYSEQRDLRMEINVPLQIEDYTFVLMDVRQIRGPNYIAEEAVITVSQDGKALPVMLPQKRRYLTTGSVMTEVALNVGFFRDLYVAKGEALDNNAWAMRVHFKPFVRWIWLGALMMAFGATLTVGDKRYRKRKLAAGIEEQAGRLSLESSLKSEALR